MPYYNEGLVHTGRGISVVTNFYYHKTRAHKDIFDSSFNSAFMGISNYISIVCVVVATPCGRHSVSPLMYTVHY